MLPFQKRRDSLEKGPDYSAKRDTLAYLKGEKKTFSEVNYTQAAYNSRDRCSECRFYVQIGQESSDCIKVVGVVKADGVCDLFSQRDPSVTSASQHHATEITIKVQ